MRPGDTDTAGRQWHSTPYQQGSMSTGSIQGVWLHPEEEVEWTWSADRTHVIGYNIKQPEVKDG